MGVHPRPVGSCHCGVRSDQPKKPWELAQTTSQSGSEKGARKGAGGRVASRPGMWSGRRQLLPKTRIAQDLHNPYPKQSGRPPPPALPGFSAPPTPHPTLRPPLGPAAPSHPASCSPALLLQTHLLLSKKPDLPRPTGLLTLLTPSSP